MELYFPGGSSRVRACKRVRMKFGFNEARLIAHSATTGQHARGSGACTVILFVIQLKKKLKKQS